MLHAIGLLAMLTVQQTDTTVNVPAGARLELDNFDGSITVEVWNRSAVRVEASHGSRDEIEVEVSGKVITVHASGHRGPATDVDFKLTVPAGIDLNLSSQSGDIHVDGVKGAVSAETVEGAITVQGGAGDVSLRSVEGDVTLSGARGRIELNSVDGVIRLTDAIGELRAETVDGEITLEGIDASSAEASTVDGNILYRGTFKENGRYRFSSHDGDVTVSVPIINAAVTVSTFSGDFESDFPVTLTSTRSGKRMNFTLGTGSARLELESFDGTIRLEKSGVKR
jgi:DUF4097 and DUF4098 domain-containing protein YvlB